MMGQRGKLNDACFLKTHHWSLIKVYLTFFFLGTYLSRRKIKKKNTHTEIVLTMVSVVYRVVQKIVSLNAKICRQKSGSSQRRDWNWAKE